MLPHLWRRTLQRAPGRLGVRLPVHRLSVYNLQNRSRLYETRPARPLTNDVSPGHDDPPDRAEPSPLQSGPAYELRFTCKPCGTPSAHRVTKQAYHHGAVLISCPGCDNRHVIADHLKIFGDTNQTIESIMQEKGVRIQKGYMLGDTEYIVDSDDSM